MLTSADPSQDAYLAGAMFYNYIAPIYIISGLTGLYWQEVLGESKYDWQ